MKCLKFMPAITLCVCSSFATAATVNIDATVSASGWAVAGQFIGQFNPDIPALEGYDINLGDTVILDVDFADSESLKLTASAGTSSVGFMLDRGSIFALYTIEGVSVSLKDFESDSGWDGTFSEASADQSGFAIGPFFTQDEVGVQDGEFIQFSGFQASYTVTAGTPGTGEFLYTMDTVNNWTTETVSPVPLPAAVWLFGSALLGLGVAKRRESP